MYDTNGVFVPIIYRGYTKCMKGTHQPSPVLDDYKELLAAARINGARQPFLVLDDHRALLDCVCGLFSLLHTSTEGRSHP